MGESGIEWVQAYNPLGSELLSTIVAGLPIVVLLALLVVGVSAARSALAGLATALLTATLAFGMPVNLALASAGFGACFGILPIAWIVVAAVFLYHLTVRAGQFEVVKRSVASLSPDRRMQALLIAFSFGAFIEGAAGFGTPVAISAALMIGLGFSPLYAAGLALIANTSPVAFGALGTPISTLAKVSGIDEMLLSQVAGRQLPLFSLIVPAWLVATMSGWRGLMGALPAVLVSGGSFAVLQFITANYHGPTLVDVIAGLGSLISLTVFLKLWRPRDIWRFPDEVAVEPAAKTDEPPLTAGSVTYAWMPWVLLSVMVFLWGWPSFRDKLNGNAKPGESTWTAPTMAVPMLHNTIHRRSPVAQDVDAAGKAIKPEEATYRFNWLSTTGTGIFIASILTALWLRIGPGVFFSELFVTLSKLRLAVFTIACMLALAFVTKFCGSDATLGLAMTKTGWWYPFFAPLLGWLGVALTGSDTSSNALFGSLQKITAQQLDLNPALIVASNSTGGVMGKMIDAQSIVVAAVATEQPNSEGKILRYVFPHSIALAILVGVVTLLQAYVFTWMIPG